MTDTLDILKIIGIDLTILLIGTFGFLAFIFDRNYYGLSVGIACCLIFVVLNILAILFFVDYFKEKENKDE